MDSNPSRTLTTLPGLLSCFHARSQPRLLPPFLLQISGLPLVGQQDVPKLAFFKTAFNAAIKDCLVEPRRAAVSLDYDYTVQQVGWGVKAQHQSRFWQCPHNICFWMVRQTPDPNPGSRSHLVTMQRPAPSAAV